MWEPAIGGGMGYGFFNDVKGQDITVYMLDLFCFSETKYFKNKTKY